MLSWNPESDSARFRRDEFIFSNFFEVENWVRNLVRTYAEKSPGPAVGPGCLRGARVAGKERALLLLPSPVFGSLKTVGISEQLSRKPPYVRPAADAFALGGRI